MSSALGVHGLQFEQDAGLLLDVEELVIRSGEIVVVTGRTDSGKTLFACLLAGLARASAGEVTVGGRRLSGGPARRRRLGLAATVADGRRIMGCTVAEALALAGGQRAALALERLPILAGRGGLGADLLSGGEQQLLQVACAWVSSPTVLVLDAPTTGLAADVVDTVTRMVSDAALEGSAVLWLDPTPPALEPAVTCRLDAGVLTRAGRGSGVADGTPG